MNNSGPKIEPYQATERTTHTASTSPTAGHSTDICHSSPDHPRMEQPAPGNSGSQVPGLFQVQACCPPVTRQTTHPLPHPLLFLVYYPPLLCHTPFHYISEVSTATSTN